MNAPLPDAVRLALEKATLDDKYTLDQGRAFMSGVQALVRLPMLQRTRDARIGLNTAGFVSGYRGSPLGGYDQALWAAKKHLAANHIVFQPGVNEELAATAVWGTQQLDLYPAQRKYDGVFGIWYGKGPGVDRCSDVFKHANMAGTARHGGVIAIAGDDHVSKSSTAPHQSDHIFKACGLPVFFPSNVQDILDMGLHALAMSRFSGVWSGMKTIQEVVESSASVEIDPDRMRIVMPTDFEMPQGGLHIRWPDQPLEQEARLMDYKWYAALAYVRANRLNHNVIHGDHDRFGIIASGKAYNDTRQALADLGLDDATCRTLGIRVHKVNVVWPLEATLTRDFAYGLHEILVVEEKRQVIEYQIKEELYNWRHDTRPNVLGKFDEPDDDQTGGEWSRPNPSQNWLLRAKADLTPAIIAKAIAKRLKKLGVPSDIVQRMDARLAIVEGRERELDAVTVNTGDRPAWFCSGCPHNTSTKVPEGSRAVAGIGCHFMAVWMDRSTSTFTQMGGEGVTWVGQSPFTTDQHIFANLGDGTYFHSGSLAIRQSIAAGVNVTYKVLYNDAVAMTGGQPVDGQLSVAAIARQVEAEGARRIAVVSDDIDKYRGHEGDFPPGTTFSARAELDAVQRVLREVPGVTLLIYEQTCAAELRRRRKKGEVADRTRRIFINERVCEGCGDCGVTSNCLSVIPVETDWGRKRQIEQSSCNKDYSCVEGFCPSFVSVQGGVVRKRETSPMATDALAQAVAQIASPPPWTYTGPFDMLVTGVGGTGIVTVGALVTMAAHLEHKQSSVLDFMGFAQKGGAVLSFVRLALTSDQLNQVRIDTQQADLLLACDMVVGASADALGTVKHGRTEIIANTHELATAAFVRNPDASMHAGALLDKLRHAAGPEHVFTTDAQAIAERFFGDTLPSNIVMLGVAFQRGLVPLHEASLRRAIELNGVAVATNLAAFAVGRLAVAAPQTLDALIGRPQASAASREVFGDGGLLARRMTFLTDYQNAAYAARLKRLVDRVAAKERAVLGGSSGSASALANLQLTRAVTFNHAKLLAIKDEYEVARLYTDGVFAEALKAQFEDGATVQFHMAPPFLGKRSADGRPLKQTFGPWMLKALRLLRRARGLRGTWFDPFGHTEERKLERQLIVDYEAIVEELLRDLTPANHGQAVAIARVPERIRGYGHVKLANVVSARASWSQQRAAWRGEGHPEPTRRVIPLVTEHSR